MMKVLILICAASTPVDNCTVDTAVSVTTGPEEINPVMCGLWGQSQIASTAIAPRDDQYEKLLCLLGR